MAGLVSFFWRAILIVAPVTRFFARPFGDLNYLEAVQVLEKEGEIPFMHRQIIPDRRRSNVALLSLDSRCASNENSSYPTDISFPKVNTTPFYNQWMHGANRCSQIELIIGEYRERGTEQNLPGKTESLNQPYQQGLDWLLTNGRA
jgi:hypothetical protein